MNDEQAINATIQTYFDGMFESDGDKARAAFHPHARISGYRYQENELQEMSVADFARFVASRQPSAKAKGERARLDVLSIDMAGRTAAVRVRDDYQACIFHKGGQTNTRHQHPWGLDEKMVYREKHHSGLFTIRPPCALQFALTRESFVNNAG